MATFGRYATSDPDFGYMGIGEARGFIPDRMPANGWGYSMGIHAGRYYVDASSPFARLGIHDTSNLSPTSRRAYTSEFQATTPMSYGGDGATYTVPIAWVKAGSSPVQTAVQLWSGVHYNLNATAHGSGRLAHGMTQHANIYTWADSTQFYYRTGLGGTTPPDPFNGFNNTQGHMTIWVNYDPNVRPDKPTRAGHALAPSGGSTVNTATPTFSGTFTDGNTNRGDRLKQYDLELRQQGQTTLLWDRAYNGTGTSWSQVYGGAALTGGVTYEWRVRYSDQFNAWSDFSDWQVFTYSAGGRPVALTPKGKIESTTPPITFSYTHVNARPAVSAKVRLYYPEWILVKESPEIAIPSLASGSSGSLTFAETTWPTLQDGVTYDYRIITKDDLGAWSDWFPADGSNYSLFNTNARPNQPVLVSPMASVPTGVRPLVVYNATDPDDDPSTGHSVSLYIRSSPNTPVNNSAEDGTLTGWTSGGAATGVSGSTLTNDNTTASSGVRSIRRSWTGATSATRVRIDHTEKISVVAGQSIGAQIAGRYDVAGFLVYPAILFYDDAGTLLGTMRGTQFTQGINTWASNQVAGTVPNGATQASISLVCDIDATEVGSIWADVPIWLGSSMTDSLRRIAAMAHVGNGRWEYQTTAVDLPYFDTYTHTAQAYDGSLFSNSPAYVSFLYQPAPVVAITAPVEGSTIVTNTPRVTWNLTLGTGLTQQSFIITVLESVPDGGWKTLYQSDVIASVDQFFDVPSSVSGKPMLRDGKTYQVQVYVTDSAGVQGMGFSNFILDFPNPTQIAGFTASEGRAHLDTVGSQVWMRWEATTYASGLFRGYVIERTPTTETRDDPRVEWLIEDPAQTFFVDPLPVSKREYTYSIRQRIEQGLDVTESTPAEQIVRMDFPYAILSMPKSNDQLVLRYYSGRRVKPEIDADYDVPWNATKPLGRRGVANYRILRMSAQFTTDDGGSVEDYIEAARRVVQNATEPIFYRDARRRKFAVMVLDYEENDVTGEDYDVSFDLVEIAVTEGTLVSELSTLLANL